MNCLGMNVTRRKDSIILDQSDYIKRLLTKFNMTDCKSVLTPMAVNSKFDKSNDKCLDDNIYKYRQLLGSLMYLSVCTRPDISYACSQLSQYSTCFDMDHWRAAKRVLRYLAGTLNYGLYFSKGNNLEITAFADADWANDIMIANPTRVLLLNCLAALLIGRQGNNVALLYQALRLSTWQSAMYAKIYVLFEISCPKLSTKI